MATPPIKFISRLANTIKTAGFAIDSVNSDGIVSPSNLQAAAQPTIDAFDDSDAAELAFENTNARASAISRLDNDKTDLLKLQRAEAGIAIDEINAIREWITSLKAAVAAASTIANLKTGVAALPNMPDRTLAQAITALKNKINGGTVD